MKIDGTHYRTIWLEGEKTVRIIDQRWLPHRLVFEDLKTVEDAVEAIRGMHVRGAPLIGATAAWGMYLAALEAAGDQSLIRASASTLIQARPTAIDLSWAVRLQEEALSGLKDPKERTRKAKEVAARVADESAEGCRMIGEHGLGIIRKIAERKKGAVVNILTHCNAGWLACVDYGTATAPIYAAHDAGIPVHVWVDETRPRNQGARLTAFELLSHGVPHTVIVDNAGGHLMQHGHVDMVIVGSDRTTSTGFVANKIGTYLKALAAHDNGIPFYAALPKSTIDWTIEDGVKGIPIEERDPDEVRKVSGLLDGEEKEVLIMPEGSKAANFAFDVTPPRLVTGIITERGVARPDSIYSLYPEMKRHG